MEYQSVMMFPLWNILATIQRIDKVCEQLEEHISRDENDDKSHNISQSNGNNIENAHQSIEENVLFTKKEEIEHSKSSAKILAADEKDSIESIQVDDKEQENNAVCEHLEEHISREENDDKLQVISQYNENNIHDAHQSIEENVLCIKKEQIEHSKPSADNNIKISKKTIQSTSTGMRTMKNIRREVNDNQ